MTDKKKGFKFSFKWGLLIYAVLITGAILFGLNYFYDFIGDYELSLPSYGTESTVEIYKTGDVTSIVNITELKGITPYLTESEILTKYNEYIKGKEIVVAKSKGYTDKNPVFDVKAEGKTVATLYLKSERKAESSFKNWIYDRIEIAEFIPEILGLSEATVIAPTGSSFKINGIVVENAILVEETEIKELALVKDYVDNLPKMQKYTITNIPEGMEVTVMNENLAIRTDKKDNVYTSVIIADEATAAEHSEYVDKAATEWAKKFINVRNSVKSYVNTSSKFWKEVTTTTTGWYPSEYIKSYDFKSKEVFEFVKYSEDCFSCRVTCEIDVKFSGTFYKDTIEKTNLRWFFVKITNPETNVSKWLISAMEYVD